LFKTHQWLQVDLNALDESDSDDSDVEMEERIQRVTNANQLPNPRQPTAKRAKDTSPPSIDLEDRDNEEEEEEEDEDIAMSDLEDLPDEEKEDLVPYSRVQINNTTALLTSLKRIKIPTDASVPFASHLSVLSSKPTAESIADIQDDLTRELALYAQCLEAAKKARTLLRKEGVPFSRPADYFAEMVKDDGHMEKVKAKLVEEASAKKAASEARKLRDLKKFGKQVQVAKQQERAKQKREALEKIKTLKRSE
jgi:rRNA-processing protein EBP2